MKKRRRRTVDPKYARGREQRDVLQQIIRDGKCPFCLTNLTEYHHLELRRYHYWVATPNQWPYRNTKAHWLLILRRHAEKIGDVSPGAWSELGEILRDLERMHGVRGGALAMRFGDSRLTGATVLHLHAHVIMPKMNRRTRRAHVVCFPIG